MHNGWVKIQRKIVEWEWYTDSRVVHLFIHLIISANHKDGKWKGEEVKRGQLITGRKQLSVETGISEQTIRTCLERLQNSGEINIRATSKFSIITICNYEDYQNIEEPTNQQTNQQLTSRNEPLFALNADEVEKINQPTNQQKNTANPTEVGVYDNKTGQTNQQTNQQLTNNQPTINQQPTTNKNVKNVKEVYTYNSFYDAQLKKEESSQQYENFVKFIFGENETREKLDNVLKIKKQLGAIQYSTLSHKCKSANIHLPTLVLELQNYNPKRPYTDLYLTLNSWVNKKISKQ